MKIPLLIALFLSTSAFALKPHQASYTLLLSDFEIGKENHTLYKDKNVYHYSAHAKTLGLASLFKDYEIHAKSTFVIDKFGLHSTRYKNFERDADTIKKDFTVYPKKQQVDSLSQTLAITHELEKNPEKTEFYLWVHNGRIAKKRYYQQVPSDDDNLIKIISKKQNLVAYFAKDKYYLPVLIHRNNFTYKLDTIQFN